MKTIALISFLCLMGLSTQAMRLDWHDERNAELAEQDARKYFQAACNNVQGLNVITQEDIRVAMHRFPNFLEWQFNGGATITHLLAYYPGDTQVLRYLLGFSPNLQIVDMVGKLVIDVCGNDDVTDVLAEYQQNPWRHPNNVFTLDVDHNDYIYDNLKFGGKKDLYDFNEFEADDYPADLGHNNGDHRYVNQFDGDQRNHHNDRDQHANQFGNGPHEKLHKSPFDIKTFMGLGAMIIFALIYRYKVSKDKEKSAAQ